MSESVTLLNLLSHKQNNSLANFAVDGGFRYADDINTNSTSEMLNDDGNLLNPTNADPYFDSKTIQKNVTGLVGTKIDIPLI